MKSAYYFGDDTNGFTVLADRAVQITMQISLSLGFEEIPVKNSYALPMVAVKGARYLEAERRYRLSGPDVNTADTMSKDDFTKLSASAALYYSAYLIEVITEHGREKSSIPTDLAWVLCDLSSNMERCYANYMSFLKEDQKRAVISEGVRLQESHAKGGKKRSDQFKEAREFAYNNANDEWKVDPKYPLSRMAEDLLENMRSNDGYRHLGLHSLPSLNTIKGWIKNCPNRTKLPRGAPKK